MFDVYKGKRVLVTGHTGFKGSWLCEALLKAGAKVYGYALEPPTKPALFEQLGLAKRIAGHTIGDIRDVKALVGAMRKAKPDIVFHLAAQPLVVESYHHPRETFDTNVMGTVNVLEAVRRLSRGSEISVICVTTDKVYENNEQGRPFRETDPFGGYDPYSASKGACEIAIASYRRAFFGTKDSAVWVASARAGNVIGGGDWAKDRIVPDCMRALIRGRKIEVRNRLSTRPWQHVLEPLSGYLALGAALMRRKNFEAVCGGFNFGPNPAANRTVRELVEEILKHCPGEWVDATDPKAVHEAKLLSLDIRKARKVLGWKPRWNFRETVEKTVEWYAQVAAKKKAAEITRKQIEDYFGE